MELFIKMLKELNLHIEDIHKGLEKSISSCQVDMRFFQWILQDHISSKSLALQVAKGNLFDVEYYIFGIWDPFIFVTIFLDLMSVTFKFNNKIHHPKGQISIQILDVKIWVSNSIFKCQSISKTLLLGFWNWCLWISEPMEILCPYLIQLRLVVFGGCSCTQPPIWIWI